MSESEEIAKADAKWEADVFRKEYFVISKSFVEIIIMILFSLGVVAFGVFAIAGILGATDYSLSVLLVLGLTVLISMSACCCSYILGVLKITQLERINENLERIAGNGSKITEIKAPKTTNKGGK